MSQNTYKMQLVIDDSQLKKVFGNMGGMGNIFGSSGGQAGNRNVFGNLGNLAKIAMGVGATVVILQKILDLSLKASPIAQSSFKLLEHAITFILRPIGDIIGLFVRPLAIMMLRWAVPFYKKFLSSPITQKALTGDIAGALMELFTSSPKVSLATKLADFIHDWLTKNLKFTMDWDSIKSTLLGIFSPIIDFKISIPDLTKAFDSIITFKDNILDTFPKITSTIKEKLAPAWTYISRAFTWLKAGWDKYVNPAWNAITSAFSDIEGAINNTLTPIWDGITGGFAWLKQVWDDHVPNAWEKIYGFFDGIAKDITTFISKRWQDFMKAINDIIDFFKSIPARLMDAIRSLLPGNSGEPSTSQMPTAKIPTQRSIFPWMEAYFQE
jgi:hypothetical protein